MTYHERLRQPEALVATVVINALSLPHRQKLAARLIRQRIRAKRIERASDTHKLTGQDRAMISGIVWAAPSWLALKGAAYGMAPI
jgi:hypothetical protein